MAFLSENSRTNLSFKYSADRLLTAVEKLVGPGFEDHAFNTKDDSSYIQVNNATAWYSESVNKSDKCICFLL